MKANWRRRMVLLKILHDLYLCIICVLSTQSTFLASADRQKSCCFILFLFLLSVSIWCKDEEKVLGYNLKCASRRMWKKQKYTYKTQFSQQETVQYTVTFLHRKNHLFVNSLTRREQKHHTLKLSDMKTRVDLIAILWLSHKMLTIS